MKDIFYQDTVTVYNKYEDKKAGIITYFPTVLENVRLLITKGANIAKSGMDTADSAMLSIHTDDLEKPYMLPKEWSRLEDKTTAFTFAAGDLFVKGDTSEEDVTTKEFAQYMKKKYDNLFTVTTVDEYKLIPHLEVGGA